MKNRIILMMLLASIYTSAIAQDCPPQNVGKTNEEYEALIQNYCKDGNGVSTNPNNLQNPACPNLKNDFEWRIKQDPSVVSVNPEFYIVYDEHGVPKSIRNPFNDPGNHEYSHIDNNHNSNYQPVDGWELLKVDFGALSNFNTGWTQLEQDRPGLNPQLGGAKLPYLILYNKYSGTFRFFGSLLGQMEGYETVRIELRIPEKSKDYQTTGNQYQEDLKATNLLSIQGDAVQPLDQETDENVLVVFAKATNAESQFFWFDIPVAYDPCLCNIRSQLDITFAFVKSANIALNGDIDAGITTLQKTDNTPYGVKVVTRVIAAGISTALAIKTGGAVVNVQAYTDLVRLYLENPNSNLSPEQKEKLEQFANYLDCGGKFSRVVQKSFSDVTDKNQKKIYKGANDILEGNTVFLSSLANGCSKKDNAAMTISGHLNLSGTWTEEIIPGHTEIIMALPGSNWTDYEMDRVPYTLNGKTLPAYPTYNERLGTFALLETPKVTYYDSSMFFASFNFFRFELTDNFKYSFNPKLNINLDKTLIYCRYAYKYGNYVEDNSSYNTIFQNGNLYPLTSPYVPIDQFINMPFIGIFHGRAYNEDLFIQFKIYYESFDLDKEGNPNTGFIIMTYPVELTEYVATSNEIPIIFVGDNLFNIQQNSKNFTTNQIFTDDETFAYDGIVTISANLSTLPGKKVKIYATMGFELLPGALIGPNIELIYGYPFLKTPQPPQTYEQVAAFCADNNKYKAQNFSNGAILAEQREYIRRKEEHEKLQQLTEAKNEPSIFPNPNSGSFQISFVYELNADAALSVTDVNGRTILSQKLNALTKSSHIELTNAKNGIYFVTITQNGHKSTHKIMVHKE